MFSHIISSIMKMTRSYYHKLAPGLQQITLISFHVTRVYMTVKPNVQKATWPTKVDRD